MAACEEQCCGVTGSQFDDVTLACKDLNEVNGHIQVSRKFLCQISLCQFTDVTLVSENWKDVKAHIQDF